jgi:DNA modification methylase
VQKRTKTRAFGTGKRESHDSSLFYDRKIFNSIAASNTASEINAVSPQNLDRVFMHSSEVMEELPDNSIALMVTSPPYNVGKEYDRDLSLNEYLDFIARVLKETHRVLVPGGRVAFNVANIGRKPYIPLNGHVASIASDIGFLMRGEIIWVKGKGSTGSCAWGSWMSAGNPTLRDLHEYVLIFCKDRFDRTARGKSTISRDEFMAATTSVWYIPAESARRLKHPAPFPTTLVERLIQLYTFEEEVILDPFMGSGSSAVAAVRTNRRFVGYEVEPAYVSICMERVSRLTGQSLSA